jgi:hypothetical protein
VIPPGREAVVIVGGAAIIILRVFVLFPEAFVALTVNLDVPIAVGVPDITPVVSFKLRPAGSVPPDIDQVIGVVPVAVSVWLYDCPVMPPGRDSVVTVGISVMTILRFIVVFPAAFVAMTVKLNVPVSVGVPVIPPFDAFKLKPVGSVPLLMDQVIGVAPVALSV